MKNKDDFIDEEFFLGKNSDEFTQKEQVNKKIHIKYQFNAHLNCLNQDLDEKQTKPNTHIVSDHTNKKMISKDDIKPEDSSEDEEIQGNKEDLDKSYPKKKPILKSLGEEEKIPSYKQARDTKLIGKFCDALKKQKILSDLQINIVINLINNKSSTIPDSFNRSFLSSLSNEHNITNFLLDLYQYRNLRKYIFCQEAGIQQNVLDGIKIAAISCL